MGLPPLDFESSASTSFTTPASVWHFFYRIRVFAVKGKAGKLIEPANLFDTVRSRSVCAGLRKTLYLSMSMSMAQYF